MAELTAAIVALSDLVPGGKELAQQQLELVRWDVVPNFPAIGRTSWSVIDDPIATPGLSVPGVKALKLKGVGLAMRTGDVVPPLGLTLSIRRPHVAITDTGELTSVIPEPAPLGGIFFDRARAEFSNAYRLVTNGCPSIVPIALYQYDQLRCDDLPHRSLGAVLSGSPVSNPTRSIALFARMAYEPHFVPQARSEWIKQLGGGDPLTALSRVAFEYGRTLREFHEAGLYRYNSNPDNYMIYLPSGRVLLIDLDSSRELAECGSLRCPLEILRDVASAAFEVARMLLNPRQAFTVGTDDIYDRVLFGQLLTGYFRECAADSWRPAVEVINETLLRNGEAWTVRLAEQAWLTATAAARRRIVPQLIRLLRECYRHSEMQERYPMD